MRWIRTILAKSLARRKLVAAVCTGIMVLYSGPAFAACSIIASPIAFGVYNGVTKAEVQTIATITVRCTDLITAVDYAVSLSPGQSGTATSRYLSNGTNRLNYQVFADAARTQVLGDGSAGTVSATGSVLAIIGIGTTSNTTQIYPNIRAGQSPVPGTYNDTLTVTVAY